MTTSFHSLNYPSHTFGYMNKHRISQYSVRTNPALAIPPSSVLLQSDESGNLLNSKKIPGSNTSQNSVCNSLLNQDNIVGIIGGVSIDSTLNFLNKLVRWSTKEGDDCPPFVLCSDPVLRKNEFVNRDGAPMENLRRKRVFLEKSGARCVVMPCHVSHSWHDEVSRGCSVPFLHMGECVARELKEANLRPVERGSPLRIGVLATVATLKAGFYQQKLQNEGFEVVVPDKATMEHTVIPATEAFNRKDMEGARNLLRIALQVLLLRAVNTVILASDDLRELLPHDDPLLKKCVDPLDALARSTIKWTLSAGKVAAYSLFDQEPLDHVHQCYSKATYLKTYDNMLAPLNGKELWTTSLTQVMLPPDVCRRAGRPKKARRREPEEEATVPPDPTKLGRKGTKMTCSKCGVQGHNKRNCKTKEPVREQSAPVDEMAEQSAHGTSGVVQERVNATMGSGIKLPKTKPKRASKLIVRRQMNKTKHNQVEQNKGLTLSQPQSQVDDPVPS